MAVAMSDSRDTAMQKGGLSEWWSEETECVFRRIERWAAFARGYDRLRTSQVRWSKTDRQRERSQNSSSSSSSSGRKLSCIDARFRGLETRAGRRSRPEEARINCCGTFSYQSNGELDSDCLEAYRYDHSIYFKTIGDIRSDKRDESETVRGDGDEETSVDSEELVEWDAGLFTDLWTDAPISAKTRDDRLDEDTSIPSIDGRTGSWVARNAWPIVDLFELNLNLTIGTSNRQDNRDANTEEQREEEYEENNNVEDTQMKSMATVMQKEEEHRRKSASKTNDREKMKKLRALRKTRRSSNNA